MFAVLLLENSQINNLMNKGNRKSMTVVICPGMHDAELTQNFLASLGERLSDFLIFPVDRYPAYSTLHLLDFLRRQFSNPMIASPAPQTVQVPLVFVGFSAGVVAAIGAAHVWRWMGGSVKAFIAIDGWGVPLWGDFPIHRLSHDHFTHWSSALMGAGEDSFYASPSVPHWDLWRSPQQVKGVWVASATSPETIEQTVQTTASEFLLSLLSRYGESRSLMV